MYYKNFEDYLMEVCMLENSSVLDDESPEFFEEWLQELDVDDIINYADKYCQTMLSNRGAK